MEIQLQELIDQIKKDGVETAEKEAAAILEAAKAEADKMIKNAKSEADKILENAKAENERMVKSSDDAIRQAGRNVLISFRESVLREVNAILNSNIDKVFSSEALAKIIVKVIEGWTKKADAQDITVILNSEDLKEVEDLILAALKEKMLKGVTLKSGDNFDGGFRISVKGGTAYYDYSTESVVDMLSGYLSPKVTKLLKEAKMDG